jgi:hypothetical protein
MNDGPEWFAPKRYGMGAGKPISWQGWALTIAFVGAIAASAFLLQRSLIALVSTMATLCAVFTIIAARTTRGGWRWRWGDED